jgi:L-seryl-tRNA(Ser) seleniumtransferase
MGYEELNMDVFSELGITKYINAHDTYTLYGGSRISEETVEAMRQISKHFVDFNELELKVGKAIAQLTGNEDCYITNGAAGALALTAAVTMCGTNSYGYHQLPDVVGDKYEVIIMRSQRNAYDKALESVGAKIVEIGNADETLDYELAGAITEHTAAVAYFENRSYTHGSIPLEKTIAIAHSKDIPVILDVAALLPPKENLNTYSKLGSDFVIFSGGKTISGPQDTGLVFASKKNADLMRRYGAPAHGICRSCKTSRESVVGLYYALKAFLHRDENVFYKECHSRLMRLSELYTGKGYPVRLIDYGPVGQAYERLVIRMPSQEAAVLFHDKMREKHVYVGQERMDILFCPVNVKDDEMESLLSAVSESLEEMETMD